MFPSSKKVSFCQVYNKYGNNKTETRCCLWAGNPPLLEELMWIILILFQMLFQIILPNKRRVEIMFFSLLGFLSICCRNQGDFSVLAETGARDIHFHFKDFFRHRNRLFVSLISWVVSWLWQTSTEKRKYLKLLCLHGVFHLSLLL